MHLDHLELRNYRNYPRLELAFGSGLNVFLGRNGQGKTNLLESVAVLALSSSPRARRECELVGHLGDEARMGARTVSAGGASQIDINIDCESGRSRRTIRVNGLPRRAVQLPGTFRVCLFWPEDLNLVKSGPEYRRRFLNQLLVQVDNGYAEALARYSRVLEQRNHLLKLVADGEQPAAALEPWDVQLADLGGRIVGARGDVIVALQRLADESHTRIASNESLTLAYNCPPAELGLALRDVLREDLRRGTTSVGPHRDDIAITLDGRDARGFASQGQQRTIVVSLKLAEAALIEERTGERPVLLLDDVLSELDLDRRALLLEEVGRGGQVIITSVDAAPFPGRMISEAEVRCITAGRIQPCA